MTADVTGIEMSFRDQRVGTSHLDRVKEDVSQEYFTSVATNLYTFRYERSDELGGMAVNFLIFNKREYR